MNEYAAEKDVFYFRSNDNWQGISWRRFEEETYEFATALLSSEAKAGRAGNALATAQVTVSTSALSTRWMLLETFMSADSWWVQRF